MKLLRSLAPIGAQAATAPCSQTMKTLCEMNDSTMKIMADITTAIERSISHNETVEVEVNDLERAYAEVVWATDECDSVALNAESLDVWGELDGEDFRLRLVRS